MSILSGIGDHISQIYLRAETKPKAREETTFTLTLPQEDWQTLEKLLRYTKDKIAIEPRTPENDGIYNLTSHILNTIEK